MAALNSVSSGVVGRAGEMNENTRILWIGNRNQSREVAEAVEKAGYEVSVTADLTAALETLRKQQIALIVLENETSCVHGELVAVRLKGVAPKVPILLLCEPLDSGAPQVFFVNLILSLRAAPELLLRSIQTLVPYQSSRKTGT
jgi:PleD family two-component response regulator